MFPVIGGKAHSEGHDLFKILAQNADKLGLQAIIWDRKIFSARTPSGRVYTGTNPHVDHLHIEMNRHFADTLTPARINSILGTAPSAPNLRPPENLRTLRLASPFMRGEDVRFAQRKMGNLNADGVFGPKTDTETRNFQKTNGLKVDGVIGKQTWTALINA
jgi:peptidoglycan hydrolase-like protein with peptidoglycan-binding domain